MNEFHFKANKNLYSYFFISFFRTKTENFDTDSKRKKEKKMVCKSDSFVSVYVALCMCVSFD